MTGNSRRSHNLSILIYALPFSVFFLALTLSTAKMYGFFGDELYYLACSKHLAFGYVDHPPLVSLLTFLGTRILGENIITLRLLSGLTGATTVLLIALLADKLGGGKTSRILSSTAVCFSTVFSAMSSFFSMNCIDIMLCTLLFVLLADTVKSPSPKKWIILGFVFGAGLLNKYTFIVLGVSLVLALVLTRKTDVLRSKWFYVSIFISFVLFSPHIIWQISNGWPTLEFIRNANHLKNISLSPLGFLFQLVVGLNPVSMTLWLPGVIYILVCKPIKEYRFLGLTAVLFIIIYTFMNSKFYYVVPVFPLFFASGAVAVEKFGNKRKASLLSCFTGSAIVITGVILMPLAVPLLPVENFVTYAKALRIWDSVRMERAESETLPLHFVYRFGWEELTDSLAEAYGNLSVEDKKDCAIIASWYGIAGAIDHFGPGKGLPPAICPHNSYWFWGTRGYSGNVVLTAGYDYETLKKYFEDVYFVSRIENPYCFNYEIYLCRKIKVSLQELWSEAKMLI